MFKLLACNKRGQLAVTSNKCTVPKYYLWILLAKSYGFTSDFTAVISHTFLTLLNYIKISSAVKSWKKQKKKSVRYATHRALRYTTWTFKEEFHPELQTSRFFQNSSKKLSERKLYQTANKLQIVLSFTYTPLLLRI